MQQAGNSTTERQQTPRLLIRIGGGTLAIAHTDRERQGGVAFATLPVKKGVSTAANLREAIRTGAIDTGKWRRVMVLLDSPVVMVPLDEYQENDRDTLYRYAITGAENSSVVATVMPQLNSVALFAVNKDLRGVLADNFSDIKIHPVSLPVWQHLHKRSLSGMEKKLYCHFHDGKVDVCSFNKNRFKFVNTFSAAHASDAAYYILNAWQLLAMDNRKDEIYLSGEPADKSALTDQLREFVTNVYAIKPTAEFNRAPITAIAGMPLDMMTHIMRTGL